MTIADPENLHRLQYIRDEILVLPDFQTNFPPVSPNPLNEYDHTFGYIYFIRKNNYCFGSWKYPFMCVLVFCL